MDILSKKRPYSVFTLNKKALKLAHLGPLCICELSLLKTYAPFEQTAQPVTFFCSFLAVSSPEHLQVSPGLSHSQAAAL